MPTPARRAISSNGASRPSSQNSCRAAVTMAARLRWASRRSRVAGRWLLGSSAVVMPSRIAGIWRLASALCCPTDLIGGSPPVLEGGGGMTTEPKTPGRDAVLVEDAAQIRMMGMPVLEPVPSHQAPYGLTDPFVLVHEARFRLSEMAGKDTRHPHRGFDNLWYVLQGSASTGHTTGPGGSIERARLFEGALVGLRTGRGAGHAEATGADERQPGRGDIEFRSVLFWVNLARKDKHAEPTAHVLHKDQIPVRKEGDAIVRTLVGEGSPVQLGTPALILDVELPDGGQVTMPVPPEFQGFAYLLDGQAVFGANKRQAEPPQLVLLGPGEELTVTAAAPGTRFLLMTGQPYGEAPVFNGTFGDQPAMHVKP